MDVEIENDKNQNRMEEMVCGMDDRDEREVQFSTQAEDLACRSEVKTEHFHVDRQFTGNSEPAINDICPVDERVELDSGCANNNDVYNVFENMYEPDDSDKETKYIFSDPKPFASVGVGEISSVEIEMSNELGVKTAVKEEPNTDDFSKPPDMGLPHGIKDKRGSFVPGPKICDQGTSQQSLPHYLSSSRNKCPVVLLGKEDLVQYVLNVKRHSPAPLVALKCREVPNDVIQLIDLKNALELEREWKSSSVYLHKMLDVVQKYIKAEVTSVNVTLNNVNSKLDELTSSVTHSEQSTGTCCCALCIQGMLNRKELAERETNSKTTGKGNLGEGSLSSNSRYRIVIMDKSRGLVKYAMAGKKRKKRNVTKRVVVNRETNITSKKKKMNVREQKPASGKRFSRRLNNMSPSTSPIRPNSDDDLDDAEEPKPKHPVSMVWKTMARTKRGRFTKKRKLKDSTVNAEHSYIKGTNPPDTDLAKK